MRIGKVAKQVGITVEAIRFYEKRGLIDEPSRNGSGYRNYPENAVPLVSFIKRAKELGFSLKEIKELLLLKHEPDSTCGDVKKQAESKIADIDQKVEDLQRIRTTLKELVASCPGQGSLNGCPIIRSIGQDKEDK